MRKRLLLDDEIPLTHQSSPSRSITQETRSRFDSLLKAALSKEKRREKEGEKKKEQFDKRETDIDLNETYSKHRKKRSPKTNETNIEKTHSNLVEISSPKEDDAVSTQDSTKTSHNKNLLPKLKTRKKLFGNTLDKNENPALENIHKQPKQNVNQHELEVANFGSSSDEQIPDQDTTPPRRLSYVKELPVNKEPASTSISPFKEMPPHAKSRPVPKPRRKHDLVHGSPHRKTLANEKEEVSSLKAPPLYSQTAVSYENIEKDGGSLTSLHRRAQSKEEIEMVTFDSKLSVSAASYEEINPLRSTREQRTEHVEETRLTRSATTSGLSYEEIIGVWIHKCDGLKQDPLVCRPLVKVYIVDCTTGEYLKKSDPNRSVAYYLENVNVNYIAPLMTQEFDFLARKSTVPSWEELLLFNDDISCIQKPDKPVIILFEILNSVSFSVASAQYKQLGAEGCWQRVAWAFLKPRAASGQSNVGVALRLQLYQPSKEGKPSRCPAYAWWRRGDWRKRSGTLHVTVKAIRPPSGLPRVLRSRMAMQGELIARSESTSEELRDVGCDPADPTACREGEESDDVPAAASSPVEWSRMPAQSCKIPNEPAARLAVAAEGCFTLKFSHSGLHLACATVSRNEYAVLVFNVVDGSERARLPGHQGLVYHLDWQGGDRRLVSSSADCTACVWNIPVDNTTTSRLEQMLPHPAFVYCALFAPAAEACVVTGCNDRVVRVWSKTPDIDMFLLLLELEEHTGFVTSMCFDQQGGLISADSVGRLLVWPSIERRKKLTPRDLKVAELQHVVINCVALHPGGKRLLVHARDSLLRMLDLATGSVIQWFLGALNYRVQTYACVSPCGGLVLAASEDGTVCVWNADTGSQAAVFASLGFHRGATAVDFHPHEHMAAFCSSTTPDGVLICRHDKASDGARLGLQLFGKRALEQAVGNHEAEEAARSLAAAARSESAAETAGLGGNSGPGSGTSRAELEAKCVEVSKAAADGEGSSDRLKLVDIIERMDKVFLSVTPLKNGGMVSESSTPVRGKGVGEDARSRRRSITHQRMQAEGRN